MLLCDGGPVCVCEGVHTLNPSKFKCLIVAKKIGKDGKLTQKCYKFIISIWNEFNNPMVKQVLIAVVLIVNHFVELMKDFCSVK